MQRQPNGYNYITPDEEQDYLTDTLYEPPIAEIIGVLTTGLQRYFEYVDVTHTTCPNLTLEPYNLAAKGLQGNEMIVRCLDNINRMFLRPQEHIPLWDLRETMELWTRKIPRSFSFLIGGGYAVTPKHPSIGILIMNATHSAPIDYNNESSVVIKDINNDRVRIETLRRPEHMMCCMNGNFFMSKGEEGNVLKICVKRRISDPSLQHINIILMIRNILSAHFSRYSDNHDMGLGGILIVKKGKIMHQVLPNDVDVNILTPDNVQNFGMTIHSEINDSPFLISLGAIIPLLTINLNPMAYFANHFDDFYTFSSALEDGGLFLNDVSSDVEYVAYFNIAKKFYLPYSIFSKEYEEERT